MKTIKFIGDPRNDFQGAKEIEFYGLILKKGKAVKCSDPLMIAKATGSSHFVVEAVKLGRPPKVKYGQNSE